VLDTLRGRDATVESLSGGERTIVAEALALSLTALSCRVSGMHRPTLVRDESGAALDASNSEAYVAMLRRAADLIGADRVLVVSHAAGVAALCDAEIAIECGKVRLV
jgi:ABC-type lipoprotein export system ATPase subunit